MDIFFNFKFIQCPINHSCVTRRNCDTCNPACNPFGNADDQKVVQVTCLVCEKFFS